VRHGRAGFASGALVCALAIAVLGTACGDVESPLASPDLQCDGEGSGTFEADLDPTVPGAATSDAALAERLDPFIAQQGRGDVVEVRTAVKAVVIDGRRVFVVEARPAPAGGFWADTMHYCRPYFEVIEPPGGTPATEAPVTTAAEGSTGAESAAFCVEAIDVLGREYPTNAAGLVESLEAIDVQALDDGDQRALAGMVSALDSSIEAFRSGQGQNGWTSTHVADLVSRLCDAEVGGSTVMP
jgi:hypothetical protein